MTFQNIQQAYTQNTGTTPTNWPIIRSTDPTVNDALNYKIGQFWINNGTTKKLWYLAAQSNQITASNPTGALQSTWELISVNSDLASLSDTGNANIVFPSLSTDTPPDNIQFIGGSGISIVGDPTNHTMTITNTGSSQSFVPDTGTSPVSGSSISVTNTTILATGTLANGIRSNGLSGSSLAYQLQYAGSNASSSAASKWGIAQFDSNQFTVASGFVQLKGGTTPPTLGLTPDSSTPPGTSPVVPNGSGNITIEGGATFATGTRANPIRTNSLAANTMDLQIQLAGSNAGSSTANNFGVSQFDSNQFTVTSGFVQLKGGTTPPTLGVVPDASSAPGTSPVVPNGSGNIIMEGGATYATGTRANPIRTNSLAANTVDFQIQLAGSNATTSSSTKFGVSQFDSNQFTVTNGFVQLAGGVTPPTLTLTANSGSNPVSPTAGGTINVLGAGSLTTVGSTNTVTVQFTGLTNHAVLVAGATGTTALTSVGPSATTGSVLASNGAAADPSFQTLASLGAVTQFTLDAATSPITPSSGNITLTCGQVATGTVGANVMRTRGNTGSSCTIEIQRSTVSATTNSTLNGVCHFDSSKFGVDANGFVTFTGSTGNIPWTDQSSNFSAASNNGYFCTALLQANLPATPAQGDVIKFVMDTTSVVTIKANTGQFIRMGNVISASAGTAASTKRGDSVELVYRSSSSTWYAYAAFTGSWTIT